MKYHFKIHKEGRGFWAECVELDGCATQGDDRPELELNMKEALNAFLSEPSGSKAIFPLPKKRVRGSRVVQVPVDPSVAFAFLLRSLRLKRGLTQSDAARLLGFKNLFSYQRLESARKANPELETLAKVRRVFPELSLDEILAV
jgi:antitoxin HicB